jgi:autotransporter-associated beta strand protein
LIEPSLIEFVKGISEMTLQTLLKRCALVALVVGHVAASANVANALDANWNVNASGNWDANANWTPNTTHPNGIDEIAGLTFNISATRTITVNVPITIGTLNMGDPTTAAYVVAASGGNVLTFDVSAGSAAVNKLIAGNTANDTISAPVVLNDDLIATIDSSGRLIMSGIISEGVVGRSITKLGTSRLELTGQNTFTGGVTLTGGSLTVNATSSTGGPGAVTSGPLGTGVFTIDGGNFVLSSSGGQINTISNAIVLNAVSTNNIALNGIGTLDGDITGAGGFTKTSAGILVLSGNNSYMGPTTITTGTVAFAKQASLYDATPANWTDANLIVGAGAAAVFSVGGAGEFTASDMDLLKGLGTDMGGFMNGSFIGFDTTNAGGNFVYGSTITNTNAGANALGIVKAGTGTLTLTSANTYSAGTVIYQGTLATTVDNALGSGGLLMGDGTNTPTTPVSLTLGGSETLESLTVATNSTSNNTITIPAGETLTLTGIDTTPANILHVGGQTGTNNRLAISGSGTFTVNDPGRNIVVALNGASATNSILDMSGLGTFNANVASIAVGRPTTTAGVDTSGSVVADSMILAGQNNITSASIVVGGTSSTGTSGLSSIMLGTSNDIGADQWVIGNGRASAIVQFQTGLTDPSVSIHGASGNTSRANITLGDQFNGSGVGSGTGGSTSTTGTMDFTGGTVNALIDDLIIGNGATATSNVRGEGNGVFMFGGANSRVNANTVVVGRTAVSGTANNGDADPTASNSTLTIDGGEFVVNSSMIIAHDLDTSATTNGTQHVAGTFNLNGGTATIGSVVRSVDTFVGADSGANPGNITAALNINGGIYTSHGDLRETTFPAGALTSTVTLNGGTLDLTGGNIGVSGALINTLNLQSGTLKNVNQINNGAGIVKSAGGSDVLTIAGNNTFSGPVAISSGALNFAESSGHDLGGFGTIMVADGTTLGVKAPSAASTAVTSSGALTLGSATGSTLNLTLAGNPTAPLMSVASITTNGTNMVNLASTYGMTSGTYTLLDYSWVLDGQGIGGLTLGTLPMRTTAASLVHNVANTSVDLNITTDSIRWNGGTNVWDVNTTANWKEIGGGGIVTYLQNEPVRFDDMAAGNFNVDVSTAVTPVSVTFDNSLNAYTLSGTGDLSTSVLRKSGSANATISTSGALAIDSMELGGTGAVIIDRADNPTLSSTLSGTGTLRKAGTNTVTLAGDSTGFAGTIDIAAGTLNVGHNNALGASTTSIAGAATLDLNGKVVDIGAGLGGATLTGTGSITSTAPGTLRVISASTVGNPISGNTTLEVDAAGGLVTVSNGSNAYTGRTILTNGTLSLSGGDNRLPTGTTLEFNPENVSGATATLDMGANNQTLAALTFPTGTTPQATPGNPMSLTIVGSGTLTLNGPHDFAVGAGGTASVTNAMNHELDMSGLNNFVYNNPTGVFSIGLHGANANGPTQNVATVDFAVNNTITAARLDIAMDAGTSGGGQTTVRLGQTNVWNVSSFSIGDSRADADVFFADGLVNPTLTMRGLAGGSSPVDSIRIGHVNDTANDLWIDSMDVSAGTIDAIVTSMVVGIAEPSSTTRNGLTEGYFTMGAGNFQVTNLTLGAFVADPVGSGTDGIMSGNGTFTLNNAAGTLSATTITLAHVPNDAAEGGAGDEKFATGTLNLLAGLVKANTITRGLQNDVGAALVVSTPNVDFSGGTIQNHDGQDLAVNDVNLRMLSSTGTATINVTGSNTATFNAGTVVSGVGVLTKTGTGTLIYQGVNSHGGTIVSAGLAKVEGAGTFSSVGQLGTNGSGIVDLNGTNQTVGALNGNGGTITSNSPTPVTLTVGGGDSGGGEYLGSIAESTTAPLGDYNQNGIVDAADYALWRRDPNAYGGDPQGYLDWRANFGSTSSPGGTITLVKTGFGEVATSGTNTYTGTTTISAGALTFGKPTALYNNQPGMWNNTKISVAADATIGFGVGGAGSFTEGQIQSYLADASSGLSVGSSIGIRPATASYTYGTVIGDSAVGMTGLSKLGPNTLVLNQNNTYTGNTHVYDGTLSVATIGNVVSGPGPLGTPASAAQAAIRLGSAADVTGTLRYTGAGETTDRDIVVWGGEAANGAIESAGSGTLTLSGAVSSGTAGSKTLTLTGANTGSNTVAGSISDGSGTLGVAKTGAGTWLLTNANTYNGTTSVSGGTLEVNGTHSGTGNVAVTGGTLKINSNWTGPGSFTGQIDVGTGTGAGGQIIVDLGAAVGNTPNMFVGSDGGNGTFTQTNGFVTIDSAAQPVDELYVGFEGGTGVYDLQSGSLSLPSAGYVNVGREGGNGTLNVASLGSATISQSLRLGAEYGGTGGGTGTLINNGSLSAERIEVGVVSTAGETTSGSITLGAGSFTSTTGPIQMGLNTGGTGTFTMNGGFVSCNDWVVIGTFGGTGHGFQHDGAISTVNFVLAQSDGAYGDYLIDNANASITTTGFFFVGQSGDADMTQTAGTISVGSFASIARDPSSTATYELSGGSFSAVGDFNVGDYGNGSLDMTGGTVATTGTGSFIVAWQPTSTGVATLSTGTIDSARNVLIANNGVGTFTMTSGTVYARNSGNPSSTSGFIVGSAANSVGVANISGGTIVAGDPTNPLDLNGADLRAGSNGMGTINMSGGTARSNDWAYVGTNSTSSGVLNLSGTAMWMPGDNMALGLNAGSKGVVNMTGGTIETIGNDPVLASGSSFGTGNLIVGRSGTGTLNMSSGLVDLKVQVVSPTPGTGSDDDTFNSVSASLAFYAAVPVAGGPLRYALDGNLYVGERNGVGKMNVTGGTVNVGANVFVGGFLLSGVDLIGGTGTLSISGGTVTVGAYSPTKGDFVLGSPATLPVSQATVNLSGGMLDVSQSVSDGMGGFWGGNIASGGAGSITAFNFTGGTLKVRAWNTLGPFGGDLGNLVQNGAGSLLDITGNDTTLLQTSQYDLGAGTATIGGGRTFTVNGVLNSTGAGVINVGTGGGAATLTAGAGAIAVDTLNLNNGNVTAGAGVTVATALNGNGTFNNSVTMGTGASVSPGLSIGTLNLLDDLTLDATGTMIIEIDGNTMSDKINVSDILSLAGTLQINVIGATPTVGQPFDILDWGSLSGTFSTIPPPANWDTTDLYTLGVVKFVALGAGSSIGGGAVPEPTGLALVTMAAIALVGRRRRS